MDEPMFHLGWYFMAFGRTEKAIDAYRRCAAKAQVVGKHVILAHLGIALAVEGQRDEALDCFRAAHENWVREESPENTSFEDGPVGIWYRLVEAGEPLEGRFKLGTFGVELVGAG